MTSFTVSESYPHPKEKVFEAFATADALAQWIAPMDGMPTTVEALNFVPEGRFRIAFDVGGEILHLAGQFMVIQAYDNLSFTWVWQPPAPHANVESHVAVSLRETGSITELTLTHNRLFAPGMSDRHRAGWLNCFSRLQQVLKENSI
jgi:uncharacterized protein YndB with AHSA1/START domain